MTQTQQNKQLRLKPHYTLAELAVILRINKTDKVRLYLSRLGVPVNKVGKSAIVLIADIISNKPELYESIVSYIATQKYIDVVERGLSAMSTNLTKVVSE
jgi:hypothetical protein